MSTAIRLAEDGARVRVAGPLRSQPGLEVKLPGLEVEEVAGVRCVHNYGYGGMGVSLSWGTARAVLEQLSES